MTLKSDGELTRGFENDIRNLVNFHATSQKFENLHFCGLLLPKSWKFLDEKLQKSYVSWHWWVIQSLKKNWLLVPKMKWGIWWISTRAVESLEICTLMFYFCRKYVMFELKLTCVIMSHGFPWYREWLSLDTLTIVLVLIFSSNMSHRNLSQ